MHGAIAIELVTEDGFAPDAWPASRPCAPMARPTTRLKRIERSKSLLRHNDQRRARGIRRDIIGSACSADSALNVVTKTVSHDCAIYTAFSLALRSTARRRTAATIPEAAAPRREWRPRFRARDRCRGVGFQMPLREAGGDPLQRVPRGDLRLAAAIREPAELVREHRGARGRALGLEHLEPRAVDRLERQRRLKALGRRRVQLPGGFQRALALDFGAVALETQGSARRRAAGPPPSVRRSPGPGLHPRGRPDTGP